MSAFSDVYDGLRTFIPTILTTHTELNNPYDIEDDSDIMYDKSWSLAIGPGENTKRILCNYVTVERDYTLVLTRRYFAPSRDIDARVAAEKLMFEDQMLVIKALVNEPQTASAEKISYNGDTGLQFIGGDRTGFLYLETSLLVEYFEQT